MLGRQRRVVVGWWGFVLLRELKGRSDLGQPSCVWWSIECLAEDRTMSLSLVIANRVLYEIHRTVQIWRLRLP